MSTDQEAGRRPVASGPRTVGGTPAARRIRRSGPLREALLLALLYGTYTASRLLASNDRPTAVRHATRLLDLEQRLHLGWEHQVVQAATAHPSLGLLASYWYSTAHYLLTPLVLVWLYRRHDGRFGAARTALVLATFAGLALYLLFPTAPPRMLPGYVDVLALHAHAGWWGADASAPRGLGGLTNELAAFPSLHAGWALWVALAIQGNTRSLALRLVGWSSALLTAVVVLATANHWVLDVAGGWLVILAAWGPATVGHQGTGGTDAGGGSQSPPARSVGRSSGWSVPVSCDPAGSARTPPTAS